MLLVTAAAISASTSGLDLHAVETSALGEDGLANVERRATRAPPPARSGSARTGGPRDPGARSGGRSEVSTSWRPESRRALKVWKNSSRVPSAPGEELDVVDEHHVGAPEAVLEALGALLAHGAHELAGELLDRRVAHAQPASVAVHVAPDGVEQVRLPEPGRAVEEERVVGLSRHLSRGQRGGVGEAVALADDELLEAVLGVEAGSLRRAGSGFGGGVVIRAPVLADYLQHQRAVGAAAGHAP